MGLLNSNSLNEWLTGIPERAREAYRGLLNTPSEVKQLFDPQFQQGLLKNATPVSREDIINQGLNISGMAPYGMAGHIVYHGSPHKFNKFDMSKIGTGEGAQAYGHGLYFAESPDVAQSYKNALSNTLESKVDAPQLEKRAAQMALTFGDNTAEGAINWLNKFTGKGAAHTSPAMTPELVESVKNRFINGDFIPGGAFYKVDIPDESIHKMLDWDKPLSQQAPEVRALLKPALDEVAVRPNKNGPVNRARDAVTAGTGAGEQLYNQLRGLRGNDALAAQQLRELGIPGIRYLDQGSRTAGEGTYNYVLFDDQLPRILEINGQPTGLLSWADEAKKVKKKK